MFTGIIEGLGTITAIRSQGGGKRLTLTSDFPLAGTRIGDSIAVNGACLTAVTLEDRGFTADVSPETLSRSTFGRARIGERVNLERAMRLSDRIDGHLVSGHIDGVGSLSSRTPEGNAVVLAFTVPERLSRYMIPKGSVAVDGISLTINTCERVRFSVSVIPHTADLTTVGWKRPGDPVNIETDMIGKYVERFVREGRPAGATGGGGIDREMLQRSGFL